MNNNILLIIMSLIGTPYLLKAPSLLIQNETDFKITAQIAGYNEKLEVSPQQVQKFEAPWYDQIEFEVVQVKNKWQKGYLYDQKIVKNQTIKQLTLENFDPNGDSSYTFAPSGIHPELMLVHTRNGKLEKYLRGFLFFHKPVFEIFPSNHDQEYSYIVTADQNYDKQKRLQDVCTELQTRSFTIGDAYLLNILLS